MLRAPARALAALSKFRLVTPRFRRSFGMI
jgi:hypothetical protein